MESLLDGEYAHWTHASTPLPNTAAHSSLSIQCILITDGKSFLVEYDLKIKPNTYARQDVKKSRKGQAIGVSTFGNTDLIVLSYDSQSQLYYLLFIPSSSRISLKIKDILDNFSKGVKTTTLSPLLSRGHLPLQKYLSSVKTPMNFFQVKCLY